MTPLQKINAIAEAHIKASQTGKFDDPKVKTKQEVIDALLKGKTFSEVLNQIEIRFVSVTSNLYSRMLDYRTGAYVKGVKKGFKVLLLPYLKK